MSCFGGKRNKKTSDKKKSIFRNEDLTIPATLEELLEAVEGKNHTCEELSISISELVQDKEKWKVGLREAATSFNAIRMKQLKSKTKAFLEGMLDQQRRLQFAVKALNEINQTMDLPGEVNPSPSQNKIL